MNLFFLVDTNNNKYHKTVLKIVFGLSASHVLKFETKDTTTVNFLTFVI